MSARESLCSFIGANYKKFNAGEIALLEAELFVKIYYELVNFFIERDNEVYYLKNKNLNYLILEEQLMKLIIMDILETGEYTLQGIAYHTDIHEDVLTEFVIGINTKPLAFYLLKIIELHKSVRSELYSKIRQKLLYELQV